jgi:hypothetical protein
LRGLDERLPHFDCLKSGSDRYAFNRLQGEWRGRSLLAFDYHYTTTSTDSKGRSQTHHHHFSAAVLTGDVPLKPLSIRSESWLDKVTQFFGFDDIDFESAEFSRNFYVKSPDRRWAYDVLHARAIEHLLYSSRFTIEFDEQHVIAYNGSQFKPEEFAQSVDLISDLLEMMPDYLVRQQRESLSSPQVNES